MSGLEPGRRGERRPDTPQQIIIEPASPLRNRLMTRAELARIARFAAMGVINVAINYSLFAALVLANVPSQLALLTGTVVSVAFAYFVGGRIVFNNSGLNSLPRFLGVYLLVYLLNAAGLALLQKADLDPLLAQLLLLPPVVALTYLLQRTLVFNRGRNKPTMLIDGEYDR